MQNSQQIAYFFAEASKSPSFACRRIFKELNVCVFQTQRNIVKKKLDINLGKVLSIECLLLKYT